MKKISHQTTTPIAGKKSFLGGSRERQTIFIVGLVIAIAGMAYLAYSYLGLSNWKETKATHVFDTQQSCFMDRPHHGTTRIFTYKVNGVEYKQGYCIEDNSSLGRGAVIRYNSLNPSESQPTSIGLEQGFAIAITAFGVIFLLAAIFASGISKK